MAFIFRSAATRFSPRVGSLDLAYRILVVAFRLQTLPGLGPCRLRWRTASPDHAARTKAGMKTPTVNRPRIGSSSRGVCRLHSGYHHAGTDGHLSARRSDNGVPTVTIHGILTPAQRTL